MSESEIEVEDIRKRVHDLANTMNKIKAHQADRDDVVVDMKHAKVSRLELLAEDLKPIFEDIPSDIEQFELAITNGETPRLWIDMTSFVRMGADGREYEFVKDTRLGRTILARSGDRVAVGERVTGYVAERILERERMIEGDWIAYQGGQPDSAMQLFEAASESDEVEEAVSETEETADVAAEASKPERLQRGLSMFVWFLIGLGVGMFLLLTILAFDQQGPLVDWLQQLKIQLESVTSSNSETSS